MPSNIRVLVQKIVLGVYVSRKRDIHFTITLKAVHPIFFPAASMFLLFVCFRYFFLNVVGKLILLMKAVCCSQATLYFGLGRKETWPLLWLQWFILGLTSSSVMTLTKTGLWRSRSPLRTTPHGCLAILMRVPWWRCRWTPCLPSSGQLFWQLFLQT